MIRQHTAQDGSPLSGFDPSKKSARLSSYFLLQLALLFALAFLVMTLDMYRSSGPLAFITFSILLLALVLIIIYFNSYNRKRLQKLQQARASALHSQRYLGRLRPLAEQERPALPWTLPQPPDSILFIVVPLLAVANTFLLYLVTLPLPVYTFVAVMPQIQATLPYARTALLLLTPLLFIANIPLFRSIKAYRYPALDVTNDGIVAQYPGQRIITIPWHEIHYAALIIDPHYPGFTFLEISDGSNAIDLWSPMSPFFLLSTNRIQSYLKQVTYLFLLIEEKSGKRLLELELPSKKQPNKDYKSPLKYGMLLEERHDDAR
ncbi:hypothetical protein EI42_02751 [Thermosporothrix hazakensis]|jgi:hypothetical protein|uniref:Uncharacterized protein n=1 Tax=Thermosporothrix hazakensis TaxID=644383 RepID=A0A326U657_THEHA|nr:hypothetical protein [Thermosporothrix hazakensis]PZW29456.1 hypothetical protein EI42_02751 [Thermosporothrix hazakensis]GCE45829.1 hypothetical protein KTH_06980 [Thermosporothrix hazakensis]